MRRPFQILVARPGTAQPELAHVAVATDCRTVALSTHGGDPAQSRGVEDQPVLLIVDAGDDPEGAIAQTKLFKAGCPSARVAILADEYHRSDLVSAYQAGANGCFVKVMSCGGFMKALEMIMRGETVLPPELLPFIADPEHRNGHATEPQHHNGHATEPEHHNGHATTRANGAMAPPDPSAPIEVNGVPRLSAREKCILRCVVDGDSNKAIARKIDIAEATVKVHVKAILRKIRLNNRTQAAIWAMNHSSLIWSEAE